MEKETIEPVIDLHEDIMFNLVRDERNKSYVNMETDINKKYLQSCIPYELRKKVAKGDEQADRDLCKLLNKIGKGKVFSSPIVINKKDDV